MTAKPDFDLVLVGGGMANAMIAARLTMQRPELRWLMLERSAALMGHTSDQTWSFHDTDLDPDDAWVKQLASHRWDGYDVNFPDVRRHFSSPYFSIRAAELRRWCEREFADRFWLNCDVVSILPQAVTLRDGKTVTASMVIDGRGLHEQRAQTVGYQKFFGMNVRLAEPHGLERPLLMDVCVDQQDGFRFVYLLPWTTHELLVEDTYYSTTKSLDCDRSRAALQAYGQARQWDILAVQSEERGCLPIPLAGCPAPDLQRGVLASGLRSGRFHPTTGYALVAAVRLATKVAAAANLTPATADTLNADTLAEWHRGHFFRRLNNMLFHAARPRDRWRVMQQFYRRDTQLIQRFYKGRLTWFDHLKVLSGKPSVPVLRALAEFTRRYDGQGDSRA